MRFFLASVLILITCFVLKAENAERGLIFYGNAKVVGKENVFVNPDNSSHTTKLNITKSAKITKKKVSPVAPRKDESARRQTSTTVIHGFPFAPTSSAYIATTGESATIAQERTDKFMQAGKTTCREKIYPYIKASDFSTYHPKQRHKLSIAAIQCGELTSFGANYPPALNTVSLQTI